MSESRKPRLLFVGEGVSLAHVGRVLELAAGLNAEHYEILVATSGWYRNLVEREGFRFHELPGHTPETFMKRLATGQALYTEDELAAQARFDAEILDLFHPDLVVSDFRVSMGIAAPARGIPLANLCNAHWSPHSRLAFPTPELPITRLLGMGLGGSLVQAAAPLVMRLQARGFNRLRKRHGLSEVRTIREMYTLGDWVLFADMPELSPTGDLPASHRYIGPIAWHPKLPAPDWLPAFAEKRPLIYATLGSSGDLSAMSGLFAALSNLPVVCVVASASRNLPTDLPPNVRVEPMVNGSALLAKASACVFNGGAATGYQALSAGVPVLALPTNADQFFFSTAAERAGAGLTLRAHRVKAPALATALTRLLQTTSFKNEAVRLQGILRARPTPNVAFQQFLRECIEMTPMRKVTRHQKAETNVHAMA